MNNFSYFFFHLAKKHELQKSLEAQLVKHRICGASWGGRMWDKLKMGKGFSTGLENYFNTQGLRTYMKQILFYQKVCKDTVNDHIPSQKYSKLA